MCVFVFVCVRVRVCCVCVRAYVCLRMCVFVSVGVCVLCVAIRYSHALDTPSLSSLPQTHLLILIFSSLSGVASPIPHSLLHPSHQHPRHHHCSHHQGQQRMEPRTAEAAAA